MKIKTILHRDTEVSSQQFECFLYLRRKSFLLCSLIIIQMLQVHPGSLNFFILQSIREVTADFNTFNEPELQLFPYKVIFDQYRGSKVKKICHCNNILELLQMFL